MGYAHINNLYKDQRILLFRECYALEKVHGTSAHVGWSDKQVAYFSGGESHENFVTVLDKYSLPAAFAALGLAAITVFGEAYGGRCQGMRGTYGDSLRFIAFDVRVGEHWLTVPDAAQLVASLGLEFVPYRKVSTDLAVLDAERDRPSEVAERRGCGSDKPREGVVLRPPIEVALNNGERIVAKHKGAAFEERKTPQKVTSPDKIVVLTEAQAVADEWVTEMRLAHVLDKLASAGAPAGDPTDTPRVLAAMVEDVTREAAGEIVASKDALTAIRKRTAKLFHQRIVGAFREWAQP